MVLGNMTALTCLDLAGCALICRCSCLNHPSQPSVSTLGLCLLVVHAAIHTEVDDLGTESQSCPHVWESSEFSSTTAVRNFALCGFYL